jgi:hypothetical protein
MALTRAKISVIDTSVEYFTDPIVILNKAASSANIDVGFIVNRNGGALSNTAVYWNETTKSFTMAQTSSSGVTDSNIAITGYANLTVGNVTVNGNISATYFTGNGSLLTGLASNYSNANVASYLTTYSGNIGNVLTTSNVITTGYFLGNGALLTGITATGSGDSISSTGSNVKVTSNYVNVAIAGTNIASFSSTGLTLTGNITAGGVQKTTSVTPPSNPVVGDQWYDSSTDILFQFTYDGTNYLWLDITSSPLSTNTAIVGTSLNVFGSGNLTSLTVTGNASVGNITATNFIGNGALLTGVIASSQSLYSNTNVAAYLTTYTGSFGNLASGITSSGTIQTTGIVYGNSGVSGTLLTASQTNITSVGNLSALAASGTIQTTGIVYANANISSTSTTTGALLVRGGVGVTGNINTTRVDVNGGSLTSTYGDQVRLGTLTTTTSNADYLEITKTRTSAGSDWTTAGYRIQQKIDNTWMGYIQFNGTSSTYGLSFGTGGSATNAVSVTDSIRIDTNGILITGIKGNATAISNGGTSGTGNIGAVGALFNTVFAKATSAQYADLAEKYTSNANYNSGTVLVFGGEQEVTTTNISHDPSVAGVVTTNPAYLMNSSIEGVAVALTGRVPCYVRGPISKGDRLATCDLPGIAQALDLTLYTPGCIIGKSLEKIETDEIKLIEIAIGRF